MQGRQGIEGTGNLSRRWPSTVKLGLLLLLSSRCGLNMKLFQTLEYSQEMTLMTENKSQEEEPEV